MKKFILLFILSIGFFNTIKAADYEQVWSYLPPSPYKSIKAIFGGKYLYESQYSVIYDMMNLNATPDTIIQLPTKFKTNKNFDVYGLLNNNSFFRYNYSTNKSEEIALDFGIDSNFYNIIDYTNHHIGIYQDIKLGLKIFDIDSNKVIREFNFYNSMPVEIYQFSPDETQLLFTYKNTIFIYDIALDSIVLQKTFTDIPQSQYLDHAVWLTDSSIVLASFKNTITINPKSGEIKHKTDRLITFNYQLMGSDSIYVRSTNYNIYFYNYINGHIDSVYKYNNQTTCFVLINNKPSYFTITDNSILYQNIIDSNNYTLTSFTINTKAQYLSDYNPKSIINNDFTKAIVKSYSQAVNKNIYYLIDFETGEISDSITIPLNNLYIYNKDFFRSTGGGQNKYYQYDSKTKQITDSIDPVNSDLWKIFDLNEKFVLSKLNVGNEINVIDLKTQKSILETGADNYYSYLSKDNQNVLFASLNDSVSVRILPDTNTLFKYKRYEISSIIALPDNSSLMYIKKDNMKKLYIHNLKTNTIAEMIFDFNIYSPKVSINNRYFALKDSINRKLHIYSMDSKIKELTIPLFDNVISTVHNSADFKYFIVKSSELQYSKSICYKLDLANLSVSTDKPEERALSIYPNPATNLLNISLQNNLIIKDIKIYNLTGELINQFNNVNAERFEIDISNYPLGSYYISADDKWEMFVKAD